MQVPRTIPILVTVDDDILETVHASQRLHQAISRVAYALIVHQMIVHQSAIHQTIGHQSTMHLPTGHQSTADVSTGYQLTADEMTAERMTGDEHHPSATDVTGRRIAAVPLPAPPSAITLHHACYARLKGQVSAQMTSTALRRVAGAYRTSWRNGHVPRRPHHFRQAVAVWLIGPDARDASLVIAQDASTIIDHNASVPADGMLSLWTVAGRKRIPYRVPPYFQEMLRQAGCVQSLTIALNPLAAANAPSASNAQPATPWLKTPWLKAWLTVTITVPDPVGDCPVGIDRGAVNSLVAVDSEDRVLFLSGRVHQSQNARTRQVMAKVRQKKTAHMAQKKDTRSVRRLAQRLRLKHANRTKNFAGQAAKALAAWAPPGAVFVLEALQLGPVPPMRADQRQGSLQAWSHGQVRRCIENKAAECGIPLQDTTPAFTSQQCSQCGQPGRRRRHAFVCLSCGHAEHADVNAARNIRDRFFTDGG